ncbi:MAG: hypothetical protein EU549_03330 [Promethearchaeota archaeon]|nr:MAG: hypothetical protein EU549_03330 [Candidatus Lokiarchaeota archaeon]
MSQFADGGLMSTKPYISSSNYILKMSDYTKDDWCKIFDALYWNFISAQRSKLEKNPRMTLILSILDKKSAKQKANYSEIANSYISKLEIPSDKEK